MSNIDREFCYSYRVKKDGTLDIRITKANGDKITGVEAQEIFFNMVESISIIHYKDCEHFDKEGSTCSEYNYNIPFEKDDYCSKSSHK